MITLLSFLILALAVKCYAIDTWRSVALVAKEEMAGNNLLWLI